LSEEKTAVITDINSGEEKAPPPVAPPPPSAADILQSHMARQNMLLDKIVLQIGCTNVALELMLSLEGKSLYASQCTVLHAVYNQKVEKINALIQKARAAVTLPPEASSQEESPAEGS
jgi:hypothetical protein